MGITAAVPRDRQRLRPRCGLLLVCLCGSNLAHAESITALLHDSPDPLVRESAAIVLGQRGSALSVPALGQCLSRDKHPWVRARCAQALGEIGAPKALAFLRMALDREKRETVRRRVATALTQLGDRRGLNELVWQLRAGTQHAKAQTMATLVRLTGMPLGQEIQKWWDYLGQGGYSWLSRPRRKVWLLGDKSRVSTPNSRDWRLLPTAVLRLGPSRKPIDVAALSAHARRYGRPPAGCLLLIDAPYGGKPHVGVSPSGQRGSRKADAIRQSPPPAVPGLSREATIWLLRQAKGTLGIGINRPSLGRRGAEGQSNRQIVLQHGGIVIEDLADLSGLKASGSQLMLVRGTAGRTHLFVL